MTLQDWADDSIDIGEWSGVVGGGGSIEINKEDEIKLLPSEQFPRWFPFLQTEEHYLAQVEKQLRQHLSKDVIGAALANGVFGGHINDLIAKIIRNLRSGYCKNLAAYYEAQGYRRFASATAQSKHIRWTVQLRVICKEADEIRQTIKEIADEEGIDENAVRKGVKRILREISLPMKPPFHSDRGRPKGSKDTPLSPRQTVGKAKRSPARS